MSMRYPGGIISATAPTVTTTSAKGVWTLEQVAQYVKAGTWPMPVVNDAYFQYNSLLLPGTGTNGAQNNTFLDSSSNALTVSRYGNATQGTFSPFSQTGWSNYFDASGDSIITSASTALQLGSGDFTVEFWAYRNSVSGSLLQLSAGTDDYSPLFGYPSGTTLQLYLSSTNSSWDIASGVSMGTLPVGEWAHFAVTRSGSTFRTFKNGTLVSTFTSSASLYQKENQASIGKAQGGTGSFDGYVSNLRVVKGTAVYTAAFTPPTTPLTAISGTSLLTCQSNRFIDNSVNALTFAFSGTPSVQAFSPFNPTAAWSSSTNGGSGYFDGTGDYLAIADNNVFDLGTSSYTMEFWVYPTSLTLDVPFAYQWDNSGGTRLVVFVQNNTGTYSVYYNDGSYSFTSSNSVTLNAWNHIAFVRNGNTFTFYINGVSGYSASNSFTYPASNLPVYIGASHNAGSFAYPYYGYISNVRVVIGTAIYTTTFTPPTAPVSNVAGTQLLCSFTNAGVYDAAAKNDLETVGNAQISTAQSKFGGSSIAFDGTGDWLVGYQTVLYNMGSGDFTVEFWVNTTTTSSGACLVGATTGGGGTNTQWGIFQGYASSTSIDVYLSNGSSYFANTGGGNVTDGNWHHVAFTRYGASGKLFLDGVQVGSTLSLSTTALAPENKPIYVGSQGGSYPFTGYIDDLRITKGVARYTTNFTPPGTAFPLF